MIGHPAPGRSCGECSLCCTVLRVDPLRKLGGVSCVHQDVAGPGCAIHATRPSICRAYTCLWLAGGLDEADRPDRLGAVLDVVSSGPTVQLEIREATLGAFDRSPRLQAIAARYRATMPVRIVDVADVLDADRPWRVLMPDGEEHRIRGEWREVVRASGDVERVRLPLALRLARRALLALRRLRVRGYRGSERG